jgi:hypothetical protein
MACDQYDGLIVNADGFLCERAADGTEVPVVDEDDGQPIRLGSTLTITDEETGESVALPFVNASLLSREGRGALAQIEMMARYLG